MRKGVRGKTEKERERWRDGEREGMQCKTEKEREGERDPETHTHVF